MISWCPACFYVVNACVRAASGVEFDKKNNSAPFLEMSTLWGVMSHVEIQSPLVSIRQQVQGCVNVCLSTVDHMLLSNLRLQSLLWPLEQGTRDGPQLGNTHNGIGSHYLLGLNRNSSLS